MSAEQTIARVEENLINTIIGKEQYLNELERRVEAGTNGPADLVTIAFLRVNLDELKNILEDLQS